MCIYIYIYIFVYSHLEEYVLLSYACVTHIKYIYIYIYIYTYIACIFVPKLDVLHIVYECII